METAEAEVVDVAAAEAAEKKVETALSTVTKEKAVIKVGATDLAFESAAELYRMAQAFSQGGVAPQGSTPGGVMAAILKGRELGIGTITAVTSIVVVKGRTQVAGALILALLKRHGIKYTFGYEGSENTRLAWIQAWDPSRGEKRGDWERHEFSWGDAVRAGLANKKGDVWRAYPDDMILWRAVSKMGRRQFPELCAGIYVHGEVPSDPDPITVEPEAEESPRSTVAPAMADPLLAELAESNPEPVSPQEEVTVPEPPAGEPTQAHPAHAEAILNTLGHDADSALRPDAPPFESNEAADKAIAEAEARQAECKHEELGPWLARGTDTGKPLICPGCQGSVKPPRKARG